MPLRKTTKSVLFYKGMTDDTDRFLAKSPAVDYTENLYEERTGSYSKRPGFEQVGGPTTTQVAPFMLHSVDNTLYTMSTDKGYYYDGSTGQSEEWPEVENNGDIGVRSLDIPVTTHPKHGARSFTACMSRDGLYYCVAFSTWTDLVGGHEVVIQSYALDGTFRGEQRIANAMDPQVFPDQGTGIHLYYMSTSGLDPIEHRTYDPADNGFTGTTSGIVNCSGNGNWSFDGGTYAPDPVNARIGFSQARGEDYNAQYHVDFTEDGSVGVVFYKDGLSSDLMAWRLTSGGTNLGTVEIISASNTSAPLAVTIADDGLSIAFMYVTRNVGIPPAHTQNVFVQKRLTATFGSLEWIEAIENESDFDLYYGHGSLAINGSNVLAAWHVAPGEEQVWGDIAYVGAVTGSALKYRELSYSSGTQGSFLGTLYGQRLASKLAVDDGKYYAVLQQWAVFTPEFKTASTLVLIPNTIIPPQAKPVSSVLCEIQDSSQVGIIGIMGANGSRRCSPTCDETTVRLPDLVVLESQKFMHINRQILVQEDVLWTIINSGSDNRLVEAYGRLGPPEAMGALNIISTDMDSVRSESLGNAIAVGSAMPVWMTGTSMSEACIIDRPEIVGVSTSEPSSGFKLSSAYFENTIPGGGEPSAGVMHKIQIVVGYSDASGNIHRSAPSAMAWMATVSNPHEDDVGLDVSVYFTPPISAFSGRNDYFAELYISTGSGGALKLAGATAISVRSASGWQSFVVTANTRVNFTDNPGDSGYEAYSPARSSPNVYTDGGVLASIAWPSITDMAVSSRRAWIISKQYPGTVFYSKLFEENVSPEFAGELIIPLGEERNLTAIGILDDKAVVFEKNDIHIIYGDGPDNRGRGQDFAVEYITTGGIGCEDAKSVVETPVGLIFYNEARGFYLLDRNRQLKFIGAGVKDLSRNLVIKAATVDPREAEVRFIVESTDPVDSDGPDADTSAVDRPPTPWFGNSLPQDACLSFNYESGIWALYTNYRGSASTLHQNRYVRVLTHPLVPAQFHVWQESADVWSDPWITPGGTKNRTLLRSHHIELGQQVQDYQRVWKITFLGRYLSSLRDLGGGVYEAGDVKVSLYFDYEKEPSQVETFKFQDFGFDPFQNPQERTERFQFEMYPVRGRCQSVKIEIEEVNSESVAEGLNYNLGRGFEIVVADFEIGLDEQESTRFLGHGARR
jgi:hypothetical protein